MCGIAGIIWKGGRHADKTLVENMSSVVAHRGPDGDGILVEENIALGHRRLAIVGIGQDGTQPMYSADGRLTIVYNGEIYNHIELRNELSALGHLFTGNSDTEVILAAYAQWGEGCLSRFNGMWAFALFDRGARSVLLARDRFGVKPLHYLETGEYVAFGSEIKQLLTIAPSRHPDEEAILDFVHFGLQDHLPDRSSFSGIKKLPAGMRMTLELNFPSPKAIRWYALPTPHGVSNLTPDDAAARLLDLLDDAVRVRLRADVPVGTCLSGGLDSSVIATLAAPRYKIASGQAFAAITASSEQADNDEAPFARLVAQHAGLLLTVVKPGYEDFAATLDALHLAQDEPIGGPSLTMQWCVMRAAKDAGLPVLLDGQGGDETLLGYERYFGNAFWEGWNDGSPFDAIRLLRDARRVNEKMGTMTALRYVLGARSIRIREAGYRIASRVLRRKHSIAPALVTLCEAGDDTRRAQQIEIEHTNLPALLRYEDRNSMHHSIETRLPFLDYRVVEAALALPTCTKLKGGWTKWPLRAGIGSRLPDSIRWRRRKLGFEAPESVWLAQHRPVMDLEIANSRLLRELIGVPRHSNALSAIDSRLRWRLYSVACWDRLYGVS